jgi:FKBP-type peptidyl-prolyl cis-trans isomerase
MNRPTYLLLLVVALLLFSCKQEDAEETQRKSIEAAIGNTYQSIDGIYFKRLRHPMCDTTITQEDTTITLPQCRHITNGTTIILHYSAKIFRGAFFATSYADAAQDAGIRPMPPLPMTAGETPVVEGVRRALMNMVVGDSVHIIFTYSLGYGEKEYIGVVPPMSAQEWTLVAHSAE